MGIYQRNFQIADIRIHIESDTSFGVSHKYEQFETPIEKGDVTIRIDTHHAADLTEFRPVFQTDSVQILQCGDRIAKVKYSEDTEGKIDWCLRQEEGQVFSLYFYGTERAHLTTFHFLYFMELSMFLIQFDAMMLHASVIRANGCGIMFTAPSGTGKSTQAELWEKYRGAEILNGDRGIIRRQDGYRVYGSTFAGSSCIYKNESAPLRAVVVLRQSPCNRICKMGKKQAYLCLLSEMSLSPWNKEVLIRQTQWLEQMIHEVPVYLLECRPDQEAVDTLYNVLKDK